MRAEDAHIETRLKKMVKVIKMHEEGGYQQGGSPLSVQSMSASGKWRQNHILHALAGRGKVIFVAAT